MRLPRKYCFFLSNFLVGSLMTLVMTFFLTLLNLGYVKNFWGIFWRGYGLGLIVALPTTFTVVPLVGKIMEKISEKDQ